MFSIDTIEQSREPVSALPAGVYRVCVSDVELKATKSGQGDFFEFTLGVVAPEQFARSKIWHRLTFNSKGANGEVAMQIGRAGLGDLMFTLQIKQFDSVEKLKSLADGKECLVEIELEFGSDGKEYPRVITCWSIAGKHRNEKRNLAEIKLGPNGKLPKASKPKLIVNQTPAVYSTDLPF